MNLFVFAVNPRGLDQREYLVCASHPTKTSLTTSEWLAIQQRARDLWAPRARTYNEAVQEAGALARKKGFHPRDPEWQVEIEEYLQDESVSIPSLRGVLIEVLHEEGFEMLEGVATHTFNYDVAALLNW
jgi:hypothetical protein